MHPREPAGEQASDPSPATRRALVSQHPCLSNWNSLSTCLLCSSGWTFLNFFLPEVPLAGLLWGARRAAGSMEHA